MFAGAALLVFVVLIVVVIFTTRRGPYAQARFARHAGFTLTAVSTFFFGLFAAGEAFSDPGGWKAAGLVAAWAAPLAALAALAWYRPVLAVPAFTALALGVIGISIWFAANPLAWRSFEDRNGPVRSLITFVLVAVVALLGLKRPAAAGVLLLAVSIIPVAISSIGSNLGLASLAGVSFLPVISGVLYLLAASLSHRPARPE